VQSESPLGESAVMSPFVKTESPVGDSALNINLQNVLPLEFLLRDLSHIFLLMKL